MKKMTEAEKQKLAWFNQAIEETKEEVAEIRKQAEKNSKTISNEKLLDKQTLKEITLPLSQADYDKLQKLKHTGQVKWSDLSMELKFAYQDFNKAEREAEWERIKHSEFD